MRKYVDPSVSEKNQEQQHSDKLCETKNVNKEENNKRCISPFHSTVTIIIITIAILFLLLIVVLAIVSNVYNASGTDERLKRAGDSLNGDLSFLYDDASNRQSVDWKISGYD